MLDPNLQPDPIPDPGVGSPTPYTANMSPEEADAMAEKTKFGIPSMPQSHEELVNLFASGQEDTVRQQAASIIDQKNSDITQEAVRNQLSQNPDPNLSLTDIYDLTNQFPPTHPPTVIEQAYSNEYLNGLTKYSGANSFIAEAQQEIPDYYKATYDAASDIMTRRQIALKAYLKAEKAYDEESYLGRAADMAKYLNPLYADMKIRGLFENSWFKGFGTDLKGGELQNQVTQAYFLNIPDFDKYLNDKVDQLAKDNPALAMEFAKAHMGRSYDDVLSDNFFNLVDLTMVPGIAKAGFNVSRRILLAYKVRGAFKQMLEAARSPQPASVSAPQGAGNLEESAVQKVLQDMAKADPVEQALDAQVTALRTDAKAAAEGPSRTYRELATRIAERTEDFATGFKEMMSNLNRVDRLSTFFKSEQNLRLLSQSLRNEYPQLGDQILDVRLSPHPFGGYNVDYILGQRGATYFDSAETADGAAKLRNLGKYTIEQEHDEARLGYSVNSEGGSYYIKMSRPLDETMDKIRDGLIVDPSMKTPTSWGAIFAKYRTPNEIFSYAHNLQRTTAVYSSNVLKAFANGERDFLESLKAGYVKIDPATGKPTSRIRNSLSNPDRQARVDEFNRILDLGKSLYNVQLKRQGYFFKSPAELEGIYLQEFGHLPDETSVHAYFSYKRLYEMDRMLRNLEVYGAKHRLGVETHTFQVGEELSPEFDGVRLKGLPGGEEKFILSMNGKVSTETFGHLSSKLDKTLKEGTDKGKLTVYRIFNPDEHELNGFKGITADNRHVYVVTDAPGASRPIDFEQVPRLEGGHYIYDYEHFVSQPNVIKEVLSKGKYRFTYLGETTIMPVRVRSMGKDVADKLNEVRKRIKADDENGAMDFHRTSGLPMNWDELKSWFNPRYDANGNQLPPFLNLDHDIIVRPKNTLSIDLPGSRLKEILENAGGFKDGTSSGSLAKQYQVEFTGERDADGLRTVVNKGTAENPIYHWEPAKLLDPIGTLNRGLNRILNGFIMDDYKIFATEHWLQEATQKGFLDVGEGQARGAPFWTFLHADPRVGAKNTAEWKFMEAQRYQIQQLWGQPSEYQKQLQQWNYKLMDTIYDRFGEGKTLAVAEWALPFTKDPLSFMRSIAFNSKVGLFAWPQIFVQSATYGQIYALAPKYAPAGSVGALFKWWARFSSSPELIDAMDKKIVEFGFGWKPGEFKEAMRLMDATGFEHVFGEHSFIDTSLNTNIIRSGGQQLLDLGQVPFQLGERNSRFGAWFTAYKEYRDAHPTGRLTDADAKMILQRADDLTGNMSRASSSALQTGVLKFSTQFLSYQIRLAEQLWGKRLKGQERLRMLMSNALLYGLPSAAALPTGSMVYDWLKKFSLQMGYHPNDDFLTTSLSEGVLAAVIGKLTGSVPNIGERYGNQGLSLFKEAFRDDPSVWRAIGGASFGIFANMIANADPLFRAHVALLSGKPESFPGGTQDLVDIFKEVSSVNAVWRYLAALHTGTWLSSGERPMSPISPWAAALHTAFGTQDQRISDLSYLSSIKKGQDNLEKYVEKEVGREYRRFLQSLADNDPTNVKYYGARVNYYLNGFGLSEDRKGDVLGHLKGLEENNTLIRVIPWETFGNPKNIPEGKIEQYQDIYSKYKKAE